MFKLFLTVLLLLGTTSSQVFALRSSKLSEQSNAQTSSQSIAKIPAEDGGGSTTTHRHIKVQRGLSALYHQVQKRRWYSWGAGHGKRPGPSYGYNDGAPNHQTAPQRFGFDCSGFSRYFAYVASGRDLLGPGNASSQLARARQLHATIIPASRGYKALRKGDLLFYGNRSQIHHVAIYAGGGRIYEAPRSNMRVHLASASRHNDFYAAMRIPF
jgi:peptidoglycan DL-endopeptidase RipA